MIWARALEINNVTTHPVLEFNCIFLIQEGGVLMVIVEVIMHLRRVEFSWITK
jgi:hypothetical protein